MLSNFQKRIIAAGGTALALVILLSTAYLLFSLLRDFVAAFESVLLPLAIASILATLLSPLIEALEVRTPLKRLGAILTLYLLTLMSLAVLAYFLLPNLLEQIGDFLHSLPNLLSQVLTTFQNNAPKLWDWLSLQLNDSPLNYVREKLFQDSTLIKEGLLKIRNSSQGLLALITQLSASLAAYSIIPVYVFFLLNGKRDLWKDLQGQLGFLNEERRDDLLFLVRQFNAILVAFFRGQIIIGFLLGAFLAIGFSIAGLQFGFLLGLLLGLLNIIPYLGTMLGIVTVLPIAYVQSESSLALIISCSGIFIAGQLLVDYVLTPKIMGKTTGMGPMLIIFAIFFWGTALNGLIGMILAIPLTAFFLVFWRLARDKYLPRITQN